MSLTVKKAERWEGRCWEWARTSDDVVRNDEACGFLEKVRYTGLEVNDELRLETYLL